MQKVTHYFVIEDTIEKPRLESYWHSYIEAKVRLGIIDKYFPGNSFYIQPTVPQRSGRIGTFPFSPFYRTILKTYIEMDDEHGGYPVRELRACYYNFNTHTTGHIYTQDEEWFEDCLEAAGYLIKTVDEGEFTNGSCLYSPNSLIEHLTGIDLGQHYETEKYDNNKSEFYEI